MFGFVNVSLIRCRWFKFVALLGPEPAMFPAGLVISSLLLLQGMWCPTIKWLNVRDEQAYCYWKPIQSIPGAVLSECKKCFCYPRFFAWRLLGEVSLFSTWSNRTRGLLQVSKSSRTRSWSERKENWQSIARLVNSGLWLRSCLVRQENCDFHIARSMPFGWFLVQAKSGLLRQANCLNFIDVRDWWLQPSTSMAQETNFPDQEDPRENMSRIRLPPRRKHLRILEGVAVCENLSCTLHRAHELWWIM